MNYRIGPAQLGLMAVIVMVALGCGLAFCVLALITIP